jgi:tetratricopeptide (TPR) repeat protein
MVVALRVCCTDRFGGTLSALMVDPDRRPTAQEIEELIDLVRRDPASPAFIDLGEAYLALGRPSDALKVGSIGLEAAPDNLEGRVMVARAHAALHQWKEAQGELLRVVKVDRASRQGFALLGEVLLRRQDFERAVPVLQHAQNLDPTSPQILAMLKRARGGQALEPPPPVPSPVPPRGEVDRGQPISRSRGPALAAPPPRGSPAPPGPPSVSPMVPTAPAVMPTMAIEPAPDWRHEPATEHMPPPNFGEPAGGQSAPSGRPARPTAPPPPMSVDGIRPRIVHAAKPQNAAAASLRQSAAVGESYLNELLTGGLLDVAGVRVPDADFDLRPDRRWGRSTRRAFIFLFVVLVLGIGGGGTWYWWTEKQRADAVARLQRESQLAIPLGDFKGFETCIKKLGEALEKDKSSLLTYAYFAQCSGLEALLYGTDADRVDSALKFARELKDGQPGAREMLIGRAAVELSRLGVGDGRQSAVAQVAISTLAEVRKSLDELAAEHPKDRWITWLRGRAMLAAGERNAARTAIRDASEGDDGLVIALIETADLLVDDGKLDEALTTYAKAEARAMDHPLIVIGRSLARAEASLQSAETLGELAVKLPKELPSRLTAYRALATSLANTAIESYVTANAQLVRAVAPPHAPTEPRFWARAAWAQYKRGDFPQASRFRANIVWFGQPDKRTGKDAAKSPRRAEDDPSVQLVDAGLLLGSGLADKALAITQQLEGVRPQLLRAYANLDLGKPKDALREAAAVLIKAPDNMEAKILAQQARMMSSEGKERAEATEALEKLARGAQSKIGRHALGVAHLALGNQKDAQIQLEQAIAEITEEKPNPVVYRTRTALAGILFDNGDIRGAGAQIDEALKANPGYFPTLVLQARVMLRNGEPDRAFTALGPVLQETTDLTPEVRLVYAEVLGTKQDFAKPAEREATRDKAIALLKDVKDKVPAAELSRVAAAIDPKLPKLLGIAEPAPAAAPAPAAPRAPERRKRR